jgi:cytochrome c
MNSLCSLTRLFLVTVLALAAGTTAVGQGSCGDVEHNCFTVALTEPAASAAAAPQASAAPAEPPAAFAVCGACHTVSEDGNNGIGPNLRGVVGRQAGHRTGFSYSSAMAKSGITWTSADLDAFLTSPSAKVPGNMMSLEGVGDAADRQAIIDYLATLR